MLYYRSKGNRFVLMVPTGNLLYNGRLVQVESFRNIKIANVLSCFSEFFFSSYGVQGINFSEKETISFPKNILIKINIFILTSPYKFHGSFASKKLRVISWVVSAKFWFRRYTILLNLVSFFVVIKGFHTYSSPGHIKL